MKTFRERLGKEWLFFDGGTGSVLQKMGLRGGELPETWNLIHPERIKELYKGYLNAGADVFNANTFGANRLHYPDNVKEIITAAVNLAKEARTEAGREDAFITIDIGPSGKLLEPLGDLSFEEAVDIFSEAIRAGAEAGADLVLIETMNDSYEAKAAVIAAKESCDLPVCITVTFDENGKLLTGASVENIVAMLEGLRVDALGVNCSLGPREMKPIVERLCKAASVPVIVNPNAGLPVTQHGMTVYPVGPDEFASLMSEIADLGIQACGGCCGTTPKHIEKLIETISRKEFKAPVKKNRTVVTSYSREVVIEDKTVIIGERINPTGKKLFKQALRDHNIDYIIGEGLKQEDAGAHILDVNVGLPEIDETAMMSEVVQKLQAVCALPLQLDSSNPQALEKAMRLYNGKPMINSVNGKDEVIRNIMPLVAKYGGVLVGLCLDEEIPETADGRINVAKKILSYAKEYGIDEKDIIIDGLCMTVSANDRSALTTLETVKRTRDELHVKSILGVSNISFGLPQRGMVNAYFLAMAMNNGLNAAIINPNNDQIMAAYRSANALLGRDSNCMDYISAYAGTQEIKTVQSVKKAEEKPEGKSSGMNLHECIVRGLAPQSKESAQDALNSGKQPLQVIDELIIPALDEVGKGFEAGTVYLPQLLMSADAAKAAFAVIKEKLSGSAQQIKGRVILATVKGDIHDIGKNIVKVMMENYGYEVIDLGKDVPPQTIVDTAIKENIRLVGLSALMTTTVVSMEETIKLLRQQKPDTKIIVGGAVLTQEYADQIGADAYGKDAMASVRYADSIFLES